MNAPPELDPRLFSEDEIEHLSGYASPWRRFKGFVRLCALCAAGGLLGAAGGYLAMQLINIIVSDN